MKKYIYSFDETAHGNTESAQLLLGNKGAQLSEMISIGLPVPHGFTISTEACKEFYSLNKKWPSGLKEQLLEKMRILEGRAGKQFGSNSNPLLVSIRSGSYVSMPGMMDTVLNLGLNDATAQALALQTKNERMAHDSYRRFLQMFGNVVLGIGHSEFESILQKKKEEVHAEYDTELDAEHLKDIVQEYKALVKEKTGKEFPQDVLSQLELAINAVFSSWNNARAISYRRINHLRGDAGTAVNVQAMVFGNMGNDSATGVAFTRNPANGAKEHYGEYLLNAQGEDVVAGIRTPKHIDEMKKELPNAYAELLKVYALLDSHYKDMQDFEFTIERGKLYLLQTRSGKRTAHAAVKIAVDMVKENLLTEREAVLRVKPEMLDQLLHKQLDELAKKESEVIAVGLPASPGAAVGVIVFSAERAVEFSKKEPHARLILARPETSPEDIEG
ncbi:MAG: pyruvate, phosphate dikinase, partial [Candidatus Diapherotrites archaeon]|nr:pyruvate, phosphate dikinase [Candidatus Diapherotrites archaeon]